MCGIFAVFRHPDAAKYRDRALELSKRIRHRGPDWNGCICTASSVFCHERLAIVGIDGGAQPIVSSDGRFTLTVNGEIYNHLQIREEYKDYPFVTHSDCETVIPLFVKYDIDAPKHLDGMFCWVLHDKVEDRLVAARDPIGICTMYMGKSKSMPEARFFASELKCLVDECDEIVAFPPGHIYDSKTDAFTQYFTPTWWPEDRIPTAPADMMKIRTSLELAVRKRLMAEVHFGVFLSGGLDSSLVASIAVRETKKLAEEALRKGARDDLTGIDATGHLHGLQQSLQLKSFAIGLPGSPDLLAAKKVADYLGTKHYSFTFTIQEGLDALKDVIYHLETYDVTTIRASTPMYLLARKMKAGGVKMALSGEGSDEIFAGYLYFADAPSAAELHTESVRRVKNLHVSDCLRANKSTMAWGLEARVPFLDLQFLETCMNIDPAEKMVTPERMEKYILRKAFDVKDDPCEESRKNPYLPDEILWRQKEQFSDGVGYSWIDSLKAAAEASVSDEDFANPKPHWGDDVPTTKEAYWYRCKFDEVFGNSVAAASTVERWIPKADWGCNPDPSGRFANAHKCKVDLA